MSALDSLLQGKKAATPSEGSSLDRLLSQPRTPSERNPADAQGIRTVDLSRTGAGEVRIGPDDSDVPRTPRDVSTETKIQKREEAGLSTSGEKSPVDHLTSLGLGGTNDPKNLLARTKAEKAYKDNVERYLINEQQKGNIGQREAVVRLQNWRYQEIPGQKPYVDTFGQKARNFFSALTPGRMARQTGEYVGGALEDAGRGVSAAAAPLATPLAFAAARITGGDETYTDAARATLGLSKDLLTGRQPENMGGPLESSVRGIRASSALMSTPLAFLFAKASGGDETFTELAQETTRLASDIIEGRRVMDDEAASFVRRRREEGKTSVPELVEEIVVLSVLGLSDLAGDPAFEASGVYRLADQAINFARFSKVGERTVTRTGTEVAEVITKEGDTIKPSVTKLKDQTVEVKLNNTQKVRMTPTKEGPVVVEGFETRFGKQRKRTSVAPQDPKQIGQAVRDVVKPELVNPSRPLPINMVRTAPRVFQLTRQGELQAGLLGSGGAETKRVQGLTQGGFKPSLVRQNPIMVGRMNFDDPASGISRGDFFVVSGHNRLEMLRNAGYDQIPEDMYQVKDYDMLGEAVKDSISENLEGKVTAYDHNVVQLLRDEAIDPGDLVSIYGGDVRKADQVATIARFADSLPDGVWQNQMKKLAQLKDLDQALVDRKMAALERMAKAVDRFPGIMANPESAKAVSDMTSRLVNVSDDRSLAAIDNRIRKLSEAKNADQAMQSDIFGAVEKQETKKPPVSKDQAVKKVEQEPAESADQSLIEVDSYGVAKNPVLKQKADDLINDLMADSGKGKVKLYHGTDSQTAKQIYEAGYFQSGKDYPSFFTTSRKEALEYANNKTKYRNQGTPEVIEIEAPKYAVSKNSSTGEYETHTGVNLYFKGKDAYVNDIELLEAFEKIKTKSQPIDIREKANQPKKLPNASELIRPKKTPEKKAEPKKKDGPGVRGLSFGVEAKAVENRLTQGFGDLPIYEKVNMKEQSEMAIQLIADDPRLAVDVAMGRSRPPDGLLPESVFVAVENWAIDKGDVRLLQRLATTSKLVTEATEMGQRISALAERDRYSPVSAISKVEKARKKAATEERLASTKKSIKREVRRAAPKKDEWLDFIDQITC